MNATRRAAIKVAIEKAQEAIDKAIDKLEIDMDNIIDEEQETFDNLPESLQSSENGKAMEDMICKMKIYEDNLEKLINDMDDYTVDVYYFCGIEY